MRTDLKNKKIVLSFLGFAGAKLLYQELAISLAKRSVLQGAFDIWAFDSDKPYLDEAGLTSHNGVLFFHGVSDVLTALQKLQKEQAIVINPLGLTPVKTFTIATLSFILPIDRPKLWAPLQSFGSNQAWEVFCDLLLSSHLIVHCSAEPGSEYPFTFDGFKEFVQQMELLPSSHVVESLVPVATNKLDVFQSWIEQTTKLFDITPQWDSTTAPLVSVITPSYNQANFIERTIQSILGQTYPNFEYIVIDGGSSDQTLPILKSFENRLTWVSEKDRGYADAVRKGFDRAKGKYLCWIPSDDEFFDSTSLSRLVASAEKTDSDVVFGNCVYVDEDSNWLDQYKTSSFNVLRLKNWCLIPQPSTLIRASTYRKANGISPDLSSVADYDLWLRIAECGGKFTRLGTPISKYRLHSKSITTSKTASTYSEVICLQIRRYGAAFPGWVRGGIGEIIHHIKGKPRVSRNPYVVTPSRGKLRVMIKSKVLEPLVIQTPFFQKLLALLLRRIDS